MRAARTAGAMATLALALLFGAEGLAPASAETPSAGSADRSGLAVQPAVGVTAGVAVFDRQTNEFTEQQNVDLQFRSASVVKLLIALDYLWDRGPEYDVPAADRGPFDAMLRSSDDTAASQFWARQGYEQVITRMVPRLGLQSTEPPPAANRTTWGYTAITAADTVRIYGYLLDSAPAKVRDLVMDNLRQATTCASDQFEQTFGIPKAFERPWAVKQGWSGFGATGGACPARLAPAPGLDLLSEAMHTTGTVGADDRAIVAVFTLHPDRTPFATAYDATTELTRGLRVPGAVLTPPPVGKRFGTWSKGIKVYADAATTSALIGTIPDGADVIVKCQKRGEEVVVGPYRNEWWAFLPGYGGYITNIYVRSPDNELPGVPEC